MIFSALLTCRFSGAVPSKFRVDVVVHSASERVISARHCSDKSPHSGTGVFFEWLPVNPSTSRRSEQKD